MDCYKLATGLSPISFITTALDFEERTMKKKPFWDYSRGESAQYAICPLCDNPIQLIALYNRTENSPKAYGRHVSHSISGLAEYSQEAYDCCPYANPGRPQPDKSDRKKNLQGLPQQIYMLLREQFDRVIYLLQQDTGIVISQSLAKTMLQNYRNERGHLYVEASLYNLPWVFAYMGGSYSLMGRIIKQDSPLAEAIAANLPECVFDENSQLRAAPKDSFQDVSFCFMAYKTKIKEHSLTESVDFVVNHGKGTPPRCIFRETLTVDQSHFLNLIELPAERARRNPALLALADELMPI